MPAQELVNIGVSITTVLAIIVGVVAGIMVAYAGLMYATAAGDPQKTGIARNAFIGAFIGSIIAGVAFIGPRIVADMVIKPVGGITVEMDVGLNCDGILRNQLVFQRGASTADRMNVVIAQIGSQHSDCASDVWDPEVIDIGGTPLVGKCYSATAGNLPDSTSLADTSNIVVGDQAVPTSLLRKGTANYKPRDSSGRDSDNNVVVYFSDTLSKRPSDGASCWLYFARLKTWHANFY